MATNNRKKKRKHPNLPNGYGSIRYLGEGRRNCYAVHPPSRADAEGHRVRPPALCYVQSWYAGVAVLTAYNAGTYKPGMEYELQQAADQSSADLDAFCESVLRNQSLAVQPHIAPGESRATFEDVYHMWHEWKYGANAVRKLSDSARINAEAAFTHFIGLHKRVMRTITLDELQAAVNSLNCRSCTIARDKGLLNQMYKFAVPRKLVSEDIARYVVVPDRGATKHGEAFTLEDIAKIWSIRNTDPVAELMIIMIYSGFRYSAYADMEVSTKEWYFRGGVKTAASKNRLVPIHSCIRPLVLARQERGDPLMPYSNNMALTRAMRKASRLVGAADHTPHDTRHTFSALCEKFGVSEADRKRMMGHSFGGDITNGVYGHRTLEDLRAEIEKIPSPDKFILT